jgi:hypothetical protein
MDGRWPRQTCSVVAIDEPNAGSLPRDSSVDVFTREERPGARGGATHHRTSGERAFITIAFNAD